jgi:hypothetical protein
MSTNNVYSTVNAGSPINYAWRGLNSLNAYASYVYVPVNIWATSLNIYYAGRGGTCYTFHAIWNAGDGSCVAYTPTVTASQGSDGVAGQAWQYANFSSPVFLLGGRNYFVGVWCNPSYQSYTPQWTNGSVAGFQSLYSVTSMNGPNDGLGGNTWNNAGVLNCQLNGYLPATMNINNNGAWTSSKAVWINNNGVWTQAKQIYLNNNGTWSPSK